MKTIRSPRTLPARQRGAALYVALIMLVLLALIGVVGMQVATLQERMSANYLAANMAFQNAEKALRVGETQVIAGAVGQYEDCGTPFDPVNWADGRRDANVASDTRIVNVSICTGQCSVAGGGDSSESLCNWYRITTFNRDRATVAESSSLAAIDTIFIKP